MVPHHIGMGRRDGLDLSKGYGRENECCEKNDDGKDAHGAQYGAEPKYRQGAQRRLERTVLRSGAIWRDDTVSFSCGIAEVLVRARMVRIMRRKGRNSYIVSNITDVYF